MHTDTLSKGGTQPFSSWRGPHPPEGYFPRPGTDEARSFYEENGFLVLDRVLPPGLIEAINAEATRLCRNEGGGIQGVPPAPEGETDAALLARILCIHMPHKISPTIAQTLAHPAIVQTLTAVIGPDVKAMQSMLFLKAAGKPGQAWHQDEDFIPTRDRSLTGAWIALDDATVENGCLWVIPGSHRPGVLWKQEWHGDRRFDCTLESRGFPYTAEDERPVEVRRGSIVFFNGYTLHRSLPNRARSGFRRSLVHHYMSASSPLPWVAREGVPIAMLDYRDIVMVAGRDPYGWKPIEDLSLPHVRASGDGGCLDGRSGQMREWKE